MTAVRFEHYVPKFYLKGFLDPASAAKRQYRVWVYRREVAPELRPYAKVGGEHGFYDHEGGNELEARLSAMEDRAARLQRTLLADGRLIGHQRRTFSSYIGLMATRGRTFFDLTKNTAARINELLQNDAILDPSDIAPTQPTRAWVLGEMLACGELMGQLFNEMSWWLITSPGDVS